MQGLGFKTPRGLAAEGGANLEQDGTEHDGAGGF
jgi:hypothetical protein